MCLAGAISGEHHIHISGVGNEKNPRRIQSRSVHLQAALEAVTATHQLEAAMDVFSLCLRPLLRQGYLQPQGQAMGADKVDTSTQSLHTLTNDLRLDSYITLHVYGLHCL